MDHDNPSTAPAPVTPDDISERTTGSSDKQEPATRISRIEERERLLAETLAHVTAQDVQYDQVVLEERRPAVLKGVLSLMLLAIAGYMAILPPPWITGELGPTVTQGDRERGVRTSLYLQAQAVETFRIREGRLPRSLQEVDHQLPGITFVRSNNRVYQLVANRPDGRRMVYDSAHPAPGFATAASFWLNAMESEQ